MAALSLLDVGAEQRTGFFGGEKEQELVAWILRCQRPTGGFGWLPTPPATHDRRAGLKPGREALRRELSREQAGGEG